MARTAAARRHTIKNFGTCLNFVGTGLVACGNNATLSTSTNTTVSAWVKTNNRDATPRLILAKWGGGNNYWFGKLNGTDYYFFGNGTQAVTASTVTISDGRWHHVVGVADAANSELRFYVDGVLKNTAAYNGTTSSAGEHLNIGTNPDTPSQLWIGKIDEPTVWNVALTTAQVQNLYYDSVVPSGVRGRWLFDEGSGSSAIDASGNANTGTITAATYSSDVVMTARTTAAARIVAGTRTAA